VEEDSDSILLVKTMVSYLFIHSKLSAAGAYP